MFLEAVWFSEVELSEKSESEEFVYVLRMRVVCTHILWVSFVWMVVELDLESIIFCSSYI